MEATLSVSECGVSSLQGVAKIDLNTVWGHQHSPPHNAAAGRPSGVTNLRTLSASDFEGRTHDMLLGLP